MKKPATLDGIKKGREQGRKQERIQLVKKLLKRHEPFEEIMNLLGFIERRD
ncbi:hypothetical protein ACIQ7N_12280 [Lysinibacillus sp. NPDC095746]|uniref:hypothetical protein n=1 Tax=Lysinibacillus sp. NPDC095746 TaxID=3364134 RepID=UPI0037F4C71A